MLNKEIAHELHLAEGTIKEYLNRIFRKLSVTNRTELAMWAVATKFLILAIFAIALAAQQPGTIAISSVHTTDANPSSTITATASNVSCVITNPAHTTARLACSVAGVTQLLQDAEPGFHLAPVSGSFAVAGNSIRWELSQPIVGVMHWQITANGVTRAGNF